MPLGAVSILAIYCLSLINVTGPQQGAGPLAGVAATIGVHDWRGGTVLSIVEGTHRMPDHQQLGLDEEHERLISQGVDSESQLTGSALLDAFLLSSGAERRRRSGFRSCRPDWPGRATSRTE